VELRFAGHKWPDGQACAGGNGPEGQRQA